MQIKVYQNPFADPGVRWCYSISLPPFGAVAVGTGYATEEDARCEAEATAREYSEGLRVI